MQRLRLQAVEVRLNPDGRLAHHGSTIRGFAVDDRPHVVQSHLNDMTIISLFGTAEGNVEVLSQALLQPMTDHCSRVAREFKR